MRRGRNSRRLEAGDPRHDEREAEPAQQGGRVAKDDHPQQEGPGGADAGPDKM